MPLIGGKTKCVITRGLGYDAYGQKRLGEKRASSCIVISLRQGTQNTTVRADSSGTRGHADETVAQGVLLFDKKETLLFGDMITLMGFTLSVIGITPVFDVMGKHDHWRVEVDIEQPRSM